MGSRLLRKKHRMGAPSAAQGDRSVSSLLYCRPAVESGNACCSSIWIAEWDYDPVADIYSFDVRAPLYRGRSSPSRQPR